MRSEPRSDLFYEALEATKNNDEFTFLGPHGFSRSGGILDPAGSPSFH
jgi:hypothetical protein